MSKKFEQEQAYKDKSILAYQLDSSQWVNDKACFMTNPTFLAYIPEGVIPSNIEIESELRNQTRIDSKCPDFKYLGKPDLAANGLSTDIKHTFPYQKNECPAGFNIVQAYTSNDNMRRHNLITESYMPMEYAPFTLN